MVYEAFYHLLSNALLHLKLKYEKKNEETERENNG